MRRIENLEIHVSHACNLSYKSCSHYSNHGHRELFSLEEADRGMLRWRNRLDPGRFSLFGGEPAMHPPIAQLSRRERPTAVQTALMPSQNQNSPYVRKEPYDG